MRIILSSNFTCMQTRIQLELSSLLFFFLILHKSALFISGRNSNNRLTNDETTSVLFLLSKVHLLDQDGSVYSYFNYSFMFSLVRGHKSQWSMRSVIPFIGYDIGFGHPRSFAFILCNVQISTF
jgi:hypothetical protein